MAKTIVQKILFKNTSAGELKRSVQFPLDKPLPLQLVTEMVVFKLKENLNKAAIKTKNKK